MDGPYFIRCKKVKENLFVQFIDDHIPPKLITEFNINYSEFVKIIKNNLDDVIKNGSVANNSSN